MISTSKWWALITWLFPIIVFPIVGGIIGSNAVDFFNKVDKSADEWFNFAKNIIFWICGLLVAQILLDLAIGATLFNHFKKKGFVIQIVAIVFSLITITLQFVSLFTVYKYIRIWDGLENYDLYQEIINDAKFLIILVPSSALLGLVWWILQIVSFGMLQSSKKMSESISHARQQQQNNAMANYPQYNNNQNWNFQQPTQMAPSPQSTPRPQSVSNNPSQRPDNIQQPNITPQQQNNNSVDNDEKFEQELERINKLYLKKKISENEYKKQIAEIERLYG